VPVWLRGEGRELGKRLNIWEKMAVIDDAWEIGRKQRHWAVEAFHCSGVDAGGIGLRPGCGARIAGWVSDGVCGSASWWLALWRIDEFGAIGVVSQRTGPTERPVNLSYLIVSYAT
jgi:hypothetical protein